MALASQFVQDSFLSFVPAFGRLAGCQFLGILLTLLLLSTLGALGLLNHAQFCVSFGHSDSGPQGHLPRSPFSLAKNDGNPQGTQRVPAHIHYRLQSI